MCFNNHRFPEIFGFYEIVWNQWSRIMDQASLLRGFHRLLVMDIYMDICGYIYGYMWIYIHGYIHILLIAEIWLWPQNPFVYMGLFWPAWCGNICGNMKRYASPEPYWNNLIFPLYHCCSAANIWWSTFCTVNWKISLIEIGNFPQYDHAVRLKYYE